VRIFSNQPFNDFITPSAIKALNKKGQGWEKKKSENKEVSDDKLSAKPIFLFSHIKLRAKYQ